MTCPKCQRAVSPVDVFCGFCRARIASVDLAPRSAAAAPRIAPAVVPRIAPAPARAARVVTATLVEREMDLGGGLEVEVAAPPATPRPSAAAAGLAGARPAGFVRRAGAYLIDAVLLAAWLLVATMAAAAAEVLPLVQVGGDPALWDVSAFDGAALVPAVLAVWLPIAALYPVCFVALEGATPGKMLMRLRVVRTDGAEVGFRRALLRELVGGLATGVTAGLAFLAVLFAADRRALHDRLGGTLVVRMP